MDLAALRHHGCACGGGGCGGGAPTPTDPAGLAEAEARQALRAHVRDRAMAARLRYGLHIDGQAIARMLGDPEVLRYPTALRFDAAALRPGEFACLLPNGDAPADGFAIVLHPHFRRQPDLWPLLLPYYFPDINYGEIVTAHEAELYGATLLGLEVDAYYQALCEIADGIP